MIGKFVMTENELTKRKPTPDPVGMGSYTIDSHNVQRYITPEGYVQNEGDIGVGISPYTIAYGCLVPKKEQCENLFASICVSSSHIAFGSIRMEPVFMILGQSAATGAALALNRNLAVQDVPYPLLREQLLQYGQVLEYTAPPSAQPKGTGKRFIDPVKLKGIVVDDDDARLTGKWKISSASANFIGHGYRHDSAAKDGKAMARYEANLPGAGRYEVFLSWPPHGNRASNVSVKVIGLDGQRTTMIDQRQPPSEKGALRSLGVHRFAKDRPAVVLVSNHGADGYVVIDAVQWVKREDIGNGPGK